MADSAVRLAFWNAMENGARAKSIRSTVATLARFETGGLSTEPTGEQSKDRLSGLHIKFSLD